MGELCKGDGLVMDATTVWDITVKRRDGSRLRFSENRFEDPENGGIVQAEDAGQIIKARIDSCHEGLSKGGCVPISFQVIATEITE
jgi:hypothetical protein